MKRANYVRLNWTAAACSRIPVAACPRIPFWLLIKRRECDAGSSLPWQPTYGFPLQPNHRFLFVFLIKEEKVVYNKRKKTKQPALAGITTGSHSDWRSCDAPRLQRTHFSEESPLGACKANGNGELVSPLGATTIEGLATHPVSRGPTSRKNLHSAPLRLSISMSCFEKTHKLLESSSGITM